MWKWLISKEKVLHKKEVEVKKEDIKDLKYEFDIKQQTLYCKHEWVQKAEYDAWLRDSYYCCICGLNK